MILLIQELQEKYDLLDENLNSIMILLIRANRHASAHCFVEFKFHYDSINSEILTPVSELLQNNLNSIMILLIR